jgi:hypothetical protein
MLLQDRQYIAKKRRRSSARVSVKRVSMGDSRVLLATLTCPNRTRRQHKKSAEKRGS